MANNSGEVIFGFLFQAAILQLSLNTILLVSVDNCTSDLMSKSAKDCVFERVWMLVENNLIALLQELDFLRAYDIHVNGVEMCVHCKICITWKPENVFGSVVYKVRDGWPVTHLLQKVSASVRRLSLVSLSKDGVQWLVPVVSGLQICNAARDHHFNSLYGVSG